MTHDAHEVALSMPDHQDQDQDQDTRLAPPGSPGAFYLLLLIVSVVLLVGAGLVILGRYQAAAVFVTVITAVAGLATALAALCRAAGGA